MTTQLPLDFQLHDDATFTSFFVGDNGQTIQALQRLCTGASTSESFIYLWGTDASGKSHLLQATCNAANERGVPSVYLPLQNWQTLSPLILQGIEKIPLICIDDIEAIAGNREWEEALFYAFNWIKNSGARLLVSAGSSPLSIPIQLPDLKSRLAWGVTYQLHRLNDLQKLQALILRAKMRGLTLNEAVAQFLLSRCARDMKELFHLLETLDNASLAEQRRLTIPFVKQVLGV